MQEGNLTKNKCPKSQYPYLSIDQLKKNQQKYTELKGEVSEYFNIKFDQQYQQREMNQNQQISNLSQNNSPDSSSTTAKPEILPKIIETSSQTRKLSYSHNVKKRLDTQKMLQNLQKLIMREKSFDLKYHVASPERKKQKKKMKGSSQKKTPSSIQNILCIENIQHKNAEQKSKMLPFPQMLKKCSKLKEIVRYEHELVNDKVITSHGIAARFYTEPLNSLELKEDSFYGANKFKIRPSVKKTIQTKLANFLHNTHVQPLRDSQKTLDIRKYTNHSVMKQRSKFGAKRNMQKRQQRYRQNKKARRSEPVKSKKDEYTVTPWDEIDLNYDLQQS